MDIIELCCSGSSYAVVYSNIEDIMDESICEMPETPIKKWHKTFLYDWLKQSHSDTLGNFDALRTRVQQYMDQPEGPPPMPEPVGGPSKKCP